MDFSPSLAALFGDGDGIEFFDRARPETAATVAADLLEGGRGEAMARRGYEKVARSGLWRHRAEQLIDFLRAG